MQFSEIISVNIWQTLISLANLVLLYFLVKHFLYERVRKVLQDRQNAVDMQYRAADEALDKANQQEATWNEKMQNAQAEADQLISDAASTASYRGSRIISDAEQRADQIVRRAEEEARLERQKAEEDMKREIIDVSTALASKLLEREINAEDHQAMIDSLIASVGEDDDRGL